MQLEPGQLYFALRKAYPTPAGWPVDWPALLEAIAVQESALVPAQWGDGGTSWGLWQRHNGPPPAPPADPAGELQYELDYVKPAVADAARAVSDTAAILRARAAAGDPVYATPDNIVDWWNIAWQFGPGALTSWARRRDRQDYRGEAFAYEISPTSNVSPQDYLDRLANVRAWYQSLRPTTRPAPLPPGASPMHVRGGDANARGARSLLNLGQQTAGVYSLQQLGVPSPVAPAVASIIGRPSREVLSGMVTAGDDFLEGLRHLLGL